MRLLRLELGAGLLLAACGGQGTAVLASSAAPAAPLPLESLALPADPGRPLVGYTWEGEGTVPVLDEVPSFLVVGEMGRTPATRLYLRGEDLEAELARQSGWSFDEVTGIGAASGRFGAGIELGPSSRIVLADAGIDPGAGEGWSMELWFKPLESQAGVLFSLVGMLEVASEDGGRIVVTTRVEGPGGTRTVLAKSPGNLTPGEWNHLGVVLDFGVIQHLRVVLNGQARSERLEGKAPETFARLSLGASSNARLTLPAVLDEVRLQARVANSSEFEAHWRARPEPLQRVTLSYADRSEPHEFWTRAVEVPRLEAGADWSVGDLSHVRPDEHGLSWVPADWKRLPGIDPPIARTTTPVVDVGNETLFLFSGEVRDSHYGRMVNYPDTWLYDTRERSWERVETPVSPPGRCHQPAAYSPDHDVVLMACGWINDRSPTELLEDLWLFHVKERRWEQRKPQGLPAVADCAVLYHPGRKVFVILSNTWVHTYDPARDAFETLGKLRLQGASAPRMCPNGPIAALDPRTNLIWLFGGAFKDENQVEEFSDSFASFDLDTRVVTYHEGPRPSARVRGAFAWDPAQEHFVLFGGVREQKSQRFDDLWTFDPDTRRWEELPYAGAITRRGGYYGMGYSLAERCFVLLAGRHSLERFLEEAWALRLDRRAEGRARFLFDRAAFPGEAAWFLESEAADGKIEAAFRASDDGRAFGPVLATCPPQGRYVEVDLRLAPGASGVAPRVRALGFRALQ